MKKVTQPMRFYKWKRRRDSKEHAIRPRYRITENKRESAKVRSRRRSEEMEERRVRVRLADQGPAMFAEVVAAERGDSGGGNGTRGGGRAP